MEYFDAHRDLESYRALVEIMPKGKMVATNLWQKSFGFYPKQQDCIVDVMNKMEENRVIPDEGELLACRHFSSMQSADHTPSSTHLAFGIMLENIFGKNSAPLRKFMRMTYWMHKFKNKQPWPLPYYLPNETLELAKLAVERITSVDRATEISVYEAKDLEESVDDTWIVSGNDIRRSYECFLYP